MSQKHSQMLAATLAAFAVGFYLTYLLNGYIRNEAAGLHFNRETVIILSRFSLLGYLVPFALLHVWRKPEVTYFGVGSFKNTIRFPLVWRGVRDPIWRNLLVFVGICTVSSIPAIVFFENDWSALLLLGISFALVNSVLEELLWRGFILSRVVEVFGEKAGLILTSLGFGFYHLNLGFSPFVCLAFSLGGFFMGGTAIRAKGLLPAMIMHFAMNMLFVVYGVIF